MMQRALRKPESLTRILYQINVKVDHPTRGHWTILITKQMVTKTIPSALTLLMACILADHPHHTFTAHDLAIATEFFY